MIRQIIFVYNADAGLLAAAWDSAKKLTASADACALCSITHSPFGEKGAWRTIDANLGLPTAYYHRDEIPSAVQDFLRAKELSLPLVIFEKDKGNYEVAVTAEMLAQCAGDPTCLKNNLETALKRFSP